MKKNAKKKKEKLLTYGELTKKYGLTSSLVRKYLPAPTLRVFMRGGKAIRVRFWPESAVLVALEREEIKAVFSERRKAAERLEAEKAAEERAIGELFRKFDIEYMLDIARSMDRHFTLHIGPTNSGKTYDAIRRLRESESGVYLGPLRLLALEMYDHLNEAGCLCTLLTGEEYEYVPGARHTASTIELCNYGREYEVAVIDEAQLIADPLRGANWTHAILCVRAKEVQLCLAPEAESIIRKMLDMAGAEYDIVRHERLAPLEYAGTFQGIRNVEPGDALITFSRKNVLSVAAALEQTGKKASVIYGALPPASRREEVRRFASGETEIVVATDAIGMGISLPIRRVLFCTAQKFDGVETRSLNVGEVKQIAGRAGRFGIYDIGYVLSNVTDRKIIKAGLEESVPDIELITTPFPKDSLESPYGIPQLIKIWQELPASEFIYRADMSEALELYEKLDKEIGGLEEKCEKSLVYELINCPLDMKSEELVRYWLDCCRAVIEGKEVPLPELGEEDLEACELKYKEYDVRHQILRRMGTEEPHLEEKERLCEKINEFLLESKTEHLRTCRHCGRVLPITANFGICNACYRLGRM